MFNYPSSILVNPSADPELAKLSYRKQMWPTALALLVSLAAVIFAAYCAIFPITGTVAVGRYLTNHEDGTTTIEEATKQINRAWPFVVSAIALLLSAVAAWVLHQEVPNRVSRRHPEMFALAILLDRYLVPEGTTPERLWNAAQLEIASAEHLGEIGQLYSARTLTKQQEYLLHRLMEERRAMRADAARELSGDEPIATQTCGECGGDMDTVSDPEGRGSFPHCWDCWYREHPQDVIPEYKQSARK